METLECGKFMNCFKCPSKPSTGSKSSSISGFGELGKIFTLEKAKYFAIIGGGLYLAYRLGLFKKLLKK